MVQSDVICGTVTTPRMKRREGWTQQPSVPFPTIGLDVQGVEGLDLSWSPSVPALSVGTNVLDFSIETSPPNMADWIISGPNAEATRSIAPGAIQDPLLRISLQRDKSLANSLAEDVAALFEPASNPKASRLPFQPQIIRRVRVEEPSFADRILYGPNAESRITVDYKPLLGREQQEFLSKNKALSKRLTSDFRAVSEDAERLLNIRAQDLTHKSRSSSTSVRLEDLISSSLPSQPSGLLNGKLERDWGLAKLSLAATATLPDAPGWQPPPWYPRRVAQPISEIIDVLSGLDGDPDAVHERLEEADRKTREMIAYLSRGAGATTVDMGLKRGLHRDLVRTLLVTTPDLINTFGAAYAAMNQAGFLTHEATTSPGITRVLDLAIGGTRGSSCIIPEPLQAVSYLAGIGLDLADRYDRYRGQGYDARKAGARALGGVFAQSALAWGLTSLVGLLFASGVGTPAGVLLTALASVGAKHLTQDLDLDQQRQQETSHLPLYQVDSNRLIVGESLRRPVLRPDTRIFQSKPVDFAAVGTYGGRQLHQPLTNIYSGFGEGTGRNAREIGRTIEW